MTEIKVTDFVTKGNHAILELASANYLEYVVPISGTNLYYTFPVPRDDMGTAVFNRIEKAITMMRWIRKAINDGTMVPWQPPALPIISKGEY